MMAIGMVTGPPQRLLDDFAALYQSRFSLNMSQMLSSFFGADVQPATNKMEIANHATQIVFMFRAFFIPVIFKIGDYFGGC